jgi:hypothetical protein
MLTSWFLFWITTRSKP